MADRGKLFADASPNRPSKALESIYGWQQDPSKLPYKPEQVSASQEQQMAYLELLARLLSNEEQYKGLISGWNPGIVGAYEANPMYESAWKTRQNPSYLNR